MLKRYQPVVSSQHFSIDYVIYSLLLTVLHPINTWVFSIALYYLASSTKCIFLSMLVTVAHYLSYLNENYKVRGTKPLQKKCILITGGSKGLGLAIVKNSLKWLDVDKVINIDIIEPVEELDEELVKFYQCDISDSLALDVVIDKIMNKYKINVLINNAGMRHDRPLNALSQSEIDKVFLVNTRAPIQLCRRFTQATSGLHVVTVSSILGTIGPRNLSVYSASKAATILIHESVSYELGDNDGFRFTLFLPGQLDTEMFKEVEVSNKFLAPVIDAEKLSLKIVEVVKQGKRGIYCFPFYCNFVPLLKCLPFGFYEYLRRFSEMDHQIVPNSIQGEANEFVMID